eukprot:6133473-Pyramimonas_sp.AAC.1
MRELRSTLTSASVLAGLLAPGGRLSWGTSCSAELARLEASGVAGRGGLARAARCLSCPPPSPARLGGPQ